MILAPALAALLLFAGCGGGSSQGDSEGSATAASNATAPEDGAGAPGPSPAASQGGDPKQGSKAGHSAKGSAPAQGSDAEAGEGQGAKHGQRIAQPKGPREQAPSSQELAGATVADISLQSPAIASAPEGVGRLPATYTCDGEGSWPALQWSGVPAGTAELILYAMSLQPVEGKLFVDWAAAGLDPSLEEVEAGRLPKGAIVGTNSFGKAGYEICPPAGSGEIYMFALYALPRALSPQKGFDARDLRRQILDVSGNVGLLPASYARG